MINRSNDHKHWPTPPSQKLVLTHRLELPPLLLLLLVPLELDVLVEALLFLAQGLEGPVPEVAGSRYGPLSAGKEECCIAAVNPKASQPTLSRPLPCIAPLPGTSGTRQTHSLLIKAALHFKRSNPGKGALLQQTTPLDPTPLKQGSRGVECKLTSAPQLPCESAALRLSSLHSLSLA
eukprot:831062-Pelagomonas_calceolata.AAC.2